MMHLLPCMATSYRDVISKDLPTIVSHCTLQVTLWNTTVLLQFIFRHQQSQLLRNVDFVYFHNHIPEPKILETQTLILLSNLPRPWQLVCRSQTEHPVRMASSPYAVIKREGACSCGIIAQHYFLHENIIRSLYLDNEVTLYYVHNKNLIGLSHEK